MFYRNPHLQHRLDNSVTFEPLSRNRLYCHQTGRIVKKRRAAAEYSMHFNRDHAAHAHIPEKKMLFERKLQRDQRKFRCPNCQMRTYVGYYFQRGDRETCECGAVTKFT